ncbi:DUF1697 domain-containing protein [Paenibacillus sacheonensis]|uniref:DUF1697 domain-containing protein n=1 Tax=Paenibacillus sacheonensis TaxID=742054 RepID=A0A7X5BVB8_9BACL|nr:DUF1697 domain-containing protein [Paenibacillus sacheonensis]MBM7563200.1 uncharacterized protein (DUF1697 family) [Paenibacillus sacheonensis]NBC68238.1 DUF1697 domain-containing protein [Paenibacillus sacheonensis]
MTNFIALIRGINVGGKNKLPMADLKRELEASGLERVQTYIQSGNIVLQSDKDAQQLRADIEAAITRVSGIVTKVMVRTESELNAIVEGCPYAEEASAEGKSVHLTVLHEPITEKQLEKLNASISDRDRYHAEGTALYCHYGQSVLDSKLAGSIAKLGDGTTTRNWNTVLKLQAMIEALKS